VARDPRTVSVDLVVVSSLGGDVARGSAPSESRRVGRGYSSSLVDPASSHMLVSKIKPCMSQYKPN
jgi:hypothetical protein